jgi:hypothetical protein
VPKLTHPIRIGEHDQTAFAFGLILDWARTARDDGMVDLLTQRTRDFYLGDRACPLAYEPSGHDFLSPCLAEADLVRRVLPPPDYGAWLGGFLPQLPITGAGGEGWWLEPAVVTDPSAQAARLVFAELIDVGADGCGAAVLISSSSSVPVGGRIDLVFEGGAGVIQGRVVSRMGLPQRWRLGIRIDAECAERLRAAVAG